MEAAPASVNDCSQTVPLFPLPNVVLLPRAVIPLHIFEDRYKTLAAHALSGPRLIAMALLQPGWLKTYHAAPAVHPVVCVGQILSSEKFEDGKYNLLLQGMTRARIVREVDSPPYRSVEVETIVPPRRSETELSVQRNRLVEFFAIPNIAATQPGRLGGRILDSSLSTSDAADLIAFNLINDLDYRQSLLAEGDLSKRIDAILGTLAAFDGFNEMTSVDLN